MDAHTAVEIQKLNDKVIKLQEIMVKQTQLLQDMLHEHKIMQNEKWIKFTEQVILEAEKEIALAQPPNQALKNIKDKLDEALEFLASDAEK